MLIEHWNFVRGGDGKQIELISGEHQIWICLGQRQGLDKWQLLVTGWAETCQIFYFLSIILSQCFLTSILTVGGSAGSRSKNFFKLQYHVHLYKLLWNNKIYLTDAFPNKTCACMLLLLFESALACVCVVVPACLTAHCPDRCSLAPPCQTSLTNWKAILCLSDSWLLDGLCPSQTENDSSIVFVVRSIPVVHKTCRCSGMSSKANETEDSVP